MKLYFHHSPKTLCTALLSLCFFIPVVINAQDRQQTIISKENALKNATSTSDSINLLLDIYSLSDKVNRNKVRVQLINLAQKNDNNEVLREMLKELSLSTDDTRQLGNLIALSQTLPEDDSLETIQTVLSMEQSKAEAPSATDTMQEDQMLEYLRTGMGLAGDKYKEIQNIYRAMMYLGASSQGPLYLEYLQRLEQLVDELPEKDHAIRNLFYTTAAIYYTRKRDYKQALDADRKLIHELDVLKAYRNKIGRENPELEYFYYVSYRRMLRNFMGLSPEELEDIYQKCLALVETNQEVQKEFDSLSLAKSYYFMGTHQFRNAVPELKKALSSENISQFRRQELLGLLAWALRETGDSKGELEALREYVTMLLAENETRRAATFREIELRNSVNKLIADEYRQNELQRDENRVMRKTSLTLVYVLAVVLIFLAQAYFRLRAKVKGLEIRNNRLHKNIEYIFDDGIPSGTKDLRHQKSRLKG